MTFLDLTTANTARCESVFHPINAWTPTDWACALAGECGEACNLVKKLRRLDGADAAEDSPEQRNAITTGIGKELADVVIYVDLLATRLGMSLEALVIAKFNEVSERQNSTIKLSTTP